MTQLSQQRCRNHALRAAVARCPQCRLYFCRECVSDHEGRVLCAACLRAHLPGTARRRTSVFSFIARTAQLLFGVFLAWLFFYGMARALLSIPSSFHEGEVWSEFEEAGK